MTKDVVIDHKACSSVITETHKPKKKIKTPTTKPFEWLSDLNHQVRGETALWVAVITQAMMDALSRANNSEAKYHKNEAICWLTGNSRNFITVCHFAGLDPDYVRRKAKRCLVAPSPWRAEAGKGKRYLERKAYRKRQKAKELPVIDDDQAAREHEKVIVGPGAFKPQRIIPLIIIPAQTRRDRNCFCCPSGPVCTGITKEK